ncbi:Ig domain-containing protein [Gracilimonas mengyeensis]|uniref:Ig domain-containing protein n=1 Tax=Gracilimonas mengyeensis TaxID=1302730 RepID=A0A521F551_9BACT|nr:Ig domain-containing protein [Gracilimonas mengyeensis]SMO91318.1 Putative Ig domain-containing protein [Gracilimonas mengyeensis]
MNIIYKAVLFLLTILFMSLPAKAQMSLAHDYRQLMEVPDIVAMEASPTHLYVLSEKDGLAVFRTYQDSLQWLYTSSGMQRRGITIRADVRFAYLYGNSRRLTVLEPTSALGVYSSTILPTTPLATARIDNNLYVAMGTAGLGQLSLESPETVDSEVKPVMRDVIGEASVLDLRSYPAGNQLFVITNAPELFVFSQNNSGNLQLENRVALQRPLQNLFIDGNDIWGSNQRGDIFEVVSSGIGKRLGSLSSPVENIVLWNDHLFARSRSGKVEVITPNDNLKSWKNDTNAGNYLAKSIDHLWIAENNKISEITLLSESTATKAVASGAFSLKDIPNQVVAYPNPLVLSLKMEGGTPSNEVEFSYRSNVDNAKIRKQGFYWQPSVTQTGTHWFNIIATNARGQIDSTRFTVDVRSFNSPPRFSPVRSTTIAVNEAYSFQFHATDPENPQSSLMRYIGVDMPEGAQLNERTGEFSWTPSERQIGETTFKVIATDRQGAASSTEVTLRVRDISRNTGD